MPASRMVSAISFGVFCRCAPSTSAIMRSRNVSPGLEVMRITIAVGEDRGAAGDRAAVAAALADDRRALAGDGRLVDGGDALDDLAVAGNDLARLADDQIALAQAAVAGHRAPRACRRRSLRAIVSVLVLRSASACALPRPSAIASAKLAKSTVNHSHSVICP